MNQRVRYPRSVAVLRVLLYAVVIGTTLALVGLSLTMLGFLAVVGTASFVLFGEASTAFLLTAVVLGLLTVTAIEVVLVSLARKADRFLMEKLRIRTPLEKITAKYVAGDIGDVEMERQIERALVRERAQKTTTSHATPSQNRRTQHSPLEIEVTSEPA
ncbi:hypothetical protein ACFQJC_07185 [Haloferax namakaokahaiae]|uniref:Uncharacterized protein n=1 Tax=Haloferax namakaokahaiae TaxID=1748331 RepID=A0ABD5ZDW7_9EURY